MTESLALITENLGKILKKMNKMNKYSSSSKSNNSQKGKVVANTFGFKKKGKGIQCHDYEGFRHIQSECANTLKKKGKSLNTT